MAGRGAEVRRQQVQHHVLLHLPLSIVVTTNRFVGHVEFDESTRKSVLDTAVSMQKTVIELSVSYAAELRRRSYVTPTSYLSLLKTFVKVSPPHTTRRSTAEPAGGVAAV